MSIVNPKEVTERGIIINTEGGNMEIQQNGIDLTLESVDLIKGGVLGREARDIIPYDPIMCDSDEYFLLSPDQSYSIMFQQKINVPENMCAQIIQRSTLNRMGGFILSGLYDSGFNNQIGAVVRTTVPIKLQKGARVAQIIFIMAESASLYNGIYQSK